MSVHFILDGYNVIKKTPVLADKSLRDGRTALVRLLELKRPQGSPRNKITIVFDGQSGVFSPLYETGHVKVVFSSAGSADDRIKRMVEESDHRKCMTVVTDDRAVRFYVRALGAGVLGVGEFLGRVLPQGRPSSGRAHSDKVIPGHLEEKINREFKDVWLSDK